MFYHKVLRVDQMKMMSMVINVKTPLPLSVSESLSHSLCLSLCFSFSIYLSPPLSVSESFSLSLSASEFFSISISVSSSCRRITLIHAYELWTYKVRNIFIPENLCTQLYLFESNIHTWFEQNLTRICRQNTPFRLTVSDAAVTLTSCQCHHNWYEWLKLYRGDHQTVWKILLINKCLEKSQSMLFFPSSDVSIQHLTCQ